MPGYTPFEDGRLEGDQAGFRFNRVALLIR